jgi:hypothetical protein
VAVDAANCKCGFDLKQYSQFDSLFAARFKKTSPPKSDEPFAMERKLLARGPMTGLACMLGAIAWFVIGWLYLGTFFYYPPVLFIIGAFVLVKGLGKERLLAAEAIPKKPASRR